MAGHAPYGVTFGRWITKGTGRLKLIFPEFSSHHRCGFFLESGNIHNKSGLILWTGPLCFSVTCLFVNQVCLTVDDYRSFIVFIHSYAAQVVSYLRYAYLILKDVVDIGLLF